MVVPAILDTCILESGLWIRFHSECSTRICCLCHLNDFSFAAGYFPAYFMKKKKMDPYQGRREQCFFCNVPCINFICTAIRADLCLASGNHNRYCSRCVNHGLLTFSLLSVTCSEICVGTITV